MLPRVLVAALLLAACGGDSGPDECVPLDGLYETTYTERSGDCDLGTFTTVTGYGSADDGQSDLQCTGPLTVDETGCKVSINQKCTDPADGATSEIAGVLTARSDGAAYKGTFSMTIGLASGPICRSLFDVVGKRL